MKIRDYDNSREYQNNFNGIKSHFVKTIKGESSVKFQNWIEGGQFTKIVKLKSGRGNWICFNWMNI
jgi:hypothetical protein